VGGFNLGTPVRIDWLGPAVLTLAITGLRIDGAPLWRDELATVSAAGRPIADLLRLIGTIDAVNGPYYLFMHGWIGVFGDSPTALRAPSALAMSGTAALTCALGRRLGDPRIGLLAGLLFAVLPSTSRYGQEARPYAFATFFAVLATLLLFRALADPAPRRWTGYAAAVTGLGLAHLVAIGLVAGQAVAVLLARRRAARWRWPLALVPAALVLTPLVVLGAGQRGRQLDWVGTPGPTDLIGLPGAVVQSGTVGGLLLGLAAAGALRPGRPRPKPVTAGPGAVLAPLVLVPTALLFLGGLVTPLWVPRYLVFVVPFGALLAAETLVLLRLPAALSVIALAGLLGAPEQAALRRTHDWPRSAPIDYPAAMRVIDIHQRPGDGIIYSPRTGWTFLDLAADYYLHPDRRPRDVLATTDQRRRADFWATECPNPASCLADVNRVWLVRRGTADDVLAGLPDPKGAALRAGFTVRQVWTVPGLTVALLER
jgi:mannosyltransferase